MSRTPVVSVDAWEWIWAPYDAPTYQLVLDQLNVDDIILEIGAGDLRLTRQMAKRAQMVYALEQNRSLLEQSSRELPANIKIITGDARTIPFPKDITTAVLLMRHCSHFSRYFDKLQISDCQKLITNARWGMNVETINLLEPRRAYRSLEIGWYACRCGNCGFKAGLPQALTEEVVDQVWDVDSCPLCTAESDISSYRFNKETFTSIQELAW